MSRFAQLAGRTIQLSEEALAQPVEQETVLLDLKSAQYFGLNEIGSRVWTLLAQQRDLISVRDALLAEYEVSAAVLEADLADLIDELAAAGLLTIEEPR